MLLILGCLVVGAVCVVELLLCQWSPFSRPIYRRTVWKAAEKVPGLHMALERAGFSPSFNTLSVSGLDAALAEFSDVHIDKVTVRFGLKKLLTGRVRIHSIDIEDLNLRVDATQPFPKMPPRGHPSADPTALAALLEFDDMDAIPEVRVGGAIHFRALLTTSGPPSEITITNLSVVLGRATNANSALPVAFDINGLLAVDGGAWAPITCSGGVDPARANPDELNLNVDLSLLDLPLSNLNTTVMQAAPLFFQDGKMAVHFEARCRQGRLSGLASFRTDKMQVADNPTKPGGKFLGLSVSMWEKLSSRQDDVIIADCNIGGTFRNPVLPLGAVLAGQV
ncbi:DUF748 domain-containing protein, partial [bacterium]|nr:DUF748 domain-containing protein [bacterium]